MEPNVSFLDENFDDVFEPEILPAGEHQLRVRSAEIVESKSTPGRKQIKVVLEDPADPQVTPIYDYLGLENPSLGDDKWKINQMKRARQSFYSAFDVDTSGSIDLAAMSGQTGWVLLSEENDDRAGVINRTKGYITPA